MPSRAAAAGVAGMILWVGAVSIGVGFVIGILLGFAFGFAMGLPTGYNQPHGQVEEVQVEEVQVEEKVDVGTDSPRAYPHPAARNLL